MNDCSLEAINSWPTALVIRRGHRGRRVGPRRDDPQLVTGARLAVGVAVCAVLPTIIAGTIVWAAVDAAYRLIEDRHYPTIADEAESWLRALYAEAER